MSTLLAQPPAGELPYPLSRAETPPHESKPVVMGNAVPLREQVARFLRGAGLTKMDVFLFGAGYAFILLLGIFLCLVARIGHTQAWDWGLRLMNLPLAAAGLGLLALAAAAAVAALRLARRGRRWPANVALGLTVLGCLGFVATILVDFDAKWGYGIRPGNQFRPNKRYVARRFGVKLPRQQRPDSDAVAGGIAAPRVVRSIDAANGQKLFLGTCASCHGPRGTGLPGQGKSLVANEFVKQRDNAGLLDFVKVGRQPWDPLNTTKVQMPPRGGNPMLSDDDLRDIVAFVRTLQTAPPVAATHTDSAQSVIPPADVPANVAAALVPDGDTALFSPRWLITPPSPGPAGLDPAYLAEWNRPQWKPPQDGVVFVNAYYLAMQFGGLCAAGVALVFAALFIQALRGRITADRCAPLALGAAGCFGVTLFWIFLFPFVYLF